MMSLSSNRTTDMLNPRAHSERCHFNPGFDYDSGDNENTVTGYAIREFPQAMSSDGSG
jgi:hypothetical protein